MLSQAKTVMRIVMVMKAAVGLQAGPVLHDTHTELSEEALDYYQPEIVKEESSISLGGNVEEILLKVLGEKDNTINVNIGELFDLLLAMKMSKNTSITPSVFISTFLSSLTTESLVIIFIAPLLFLFLTSISAMVAVPTLLMGLSLMSEGRIQTLDELSAFEAIPEPIALPSLENIPDFEMINSAAPRLWEDVY